LRPLGPKKEDFFLYSKPNVKRSTHCSFFTFGSNVVINFFVSLDAGSLVTWVRRHTASRVTGSSAGVLEAAGSNTCARENVFKLKMEVTGVL